LQGPKGEKGEQGEAGRPGSILVSQALVGPETASLNTPLSIPGGSLTTLVPVAQFWLQNGDYVVNANVDLGSTLPIGQQYTCQLTAPIQTDPIDSLPIIYGLQTRLSLSGTVRLQSPTLLTLSCGSDAPARLLKARITVLHVDQINPAMMGMLRN
jgi:hypothetical protein